MSANPYYKEWDFTGQGGKKYRTKYETTHPNADLYSGGWGIEEWMPQMNQWVSRVGESFLKNPDETTGFANNPEQFWQAVGGGNPLSFGSQDQIESWIRQAGQYQAGRLQNKLNRTAMGEAGPGGAAEDPYLAQLKVQQYQLQHDRPWNPSNNPAYLSPMAGESMPDFLKRKTAWEASPEGKARLATANDWTKSGAYSQVGNDWVSNPYREVNRKIDAYTQWKKQNPSGTQQQFEAVYQPGYSAGGAAANFDTTANPYFKQIQAAAQPTTPTNQPTAGGSTPASNPAGGQYDDLIGAIQKALQGFFPQGNPQSQGSITGQWGGIPGMGQAMGGYQNPNTPPSQGYPNMWDYFGPQYWNTYGARPGGVNANMLLGDMIWEPGAMAPGQPAVPWGNPMNMGMDPYSRFAGLGPSQYPLDENGQPWTWAPPSDWSGIFGGGGGGNNNNGGGNNNGGFNWDVFNDFDWGQVPWNDPAFQQASAGWGEPWSTEWFINLWNYFNPPAGNNNNAGGTSAGGAGMPPGGNVGGLQVSTMPGNMTSGPAAGGAGSMYSGGNVSGMGGSIWDWGGNNNGPNPYGWHVTPWEGEDVSWSMHPYLEQILGPMSYYLSSQWNAPQEAYTGQLSPFWSPLQQMSDMMGQGFALSKMGMTGLNPATMTAFNTLGQFAQSGYANPTIQAGNYLPDWMQAAMGAGTFEGGG